MPCFQCHVSVPVTSRHCSRCGAMVRWRDWQVVRRIGQGGNGTTYLVQQAQQQAVLKVPAAHVTPQQHQTECRNLYLAASLGVAPAPIETAPDGLLMSYEPAPTQMPVYERARLFVRGLNMLHTRSLVHRDIKPENVVGHRLIDLGSLLDQERDWDYEPIGTPGYAAPEAYQGHVAPSIDAYGAGWVLVAWLGGPDPNPATFGHPAHWHCPDAQIAPLIAGLLQPDPTQRLSIGQAYHTLTGPWCRLGDGTQLGSSLVSTGQWWQVLPDAPCRDVGGMATEMQQADVQRFLAATGCRLPTVAELRQLGRGTERQQVWRDYGRVMQHGLISDLGAALCRRFLWQPTSDGLLWGGTTYADSETLPDPRQANAMIGLRVVAT